MLSSIESGLRRTRKGEHAPLKAIEALRAAVTTPFHEGLATEARLFAELKNSSQSRALRHLFLAERQAAKLRGIPVDTPVRAIRRVGVVGGGEDVVVGSTRRRGAPQSATSLSCSDDADG